MAVMRSLAAGAIDKVSKEYRQRNFRKSVYFVLMGEKGRKPLSLDSFDAMFFSVVLRLRHCIPRICF